MCKFFCRNDIILIASILAVSILFMILNGVFHEEGKKVIVYTDGTVMGEYSLSKDQSITIDGYSGGHNVLTISGGTACMSDASCPDKLCMHQGKVSRSGQSIVCLPNRVVIKIEGEDAGGYDAVTR